ncbi:MAG: NUDIX domain-containing protein [Actinomycetota bacterium]
MTRRVELAVGAVVRHDDHLLLIRRATPPEAGRWSLPGGRVEPGERMVDAAAREVREETGLEVSVGDPFDWVERIGPDHHFVIVDFAATVERLVVPVAGDDAAEARWVPAAAVADLALVDGLLDFLRANTVVD